MSNPEYFEVKYSIDIVSRAKQRSALIHRSLLSRNIPNLLRAFQTYVSPTCRIL